MISSYNIFYRMLTNVEIQIRSVDDFPFSQGLRWSPVSQGRTPIDISRRLDLEVGKSSASVL